MAGKRIKISMIDPEISIMMDKAKEEVRQYAIRRYEMMMDKAMMKEGEMMMKDADKMMEKAKAMKEKGKEKMRKAKGMKGGK
jgi:hypothetical protein